MILHFAREYFKFLFYKHEGNISVFILHVFDTVQISNHKVEIRWTIFSNGLGKVISGQNDAYAMCYKTGFREKILNWPKKSWGSMFVNTYELKLNTEETKVKVEENNQIKDRKKPKSIGLTKYYFYPKKYLNDHDLTTVWSRTCKISLKRFFAGRFDYIAINPVIIDYYSRQLNEKQNYRFVDIMFGPRDLYICFSKTPRGEYFRNIFDKNYEIYIKSGRRKKLIEKWQKKLQIKTPILIGLKK